MKQLFQKALFCSVLAAAAILAGPAAGGHSDFSDTRTIIDQTGRRAVVPASVARASVISVNLEETLVALGVWDRLAALPGTSFNNPLVNALDLPPKRQTTFSDAANFNLESLFQAEPDVIITWSGNNVLINRLEDFRFPVISVHPRDLDGMIRMVRVLAETFGQPDRADRVLGWFREIEKILKEKHPEQPARVLWLGGARTLVYGDKWIFHDLIKTAGGEDVTGGLSFKPWVAELSMEQIVRLDPEIIVIGGWAPYGPEDLYRDQRWGHVAAVKHRRVYKTPEGRANFSPYALLMAVMTAHWCYPERLSAAEALTIINTYHHKFYGIRFDAVHPEFAEAFGNGG